MARASFRTSFSIERRVGIAGEGAQGHSRQGLPQLLARGDFGTVTSSIRSNAVAQLVVRNLSDEVKEPLKRRAKRHGRSLEAEVRAVPEEVPEPPAIEPQSPTGQGWASQLADKMRELGLTDEEWQEFDQSLREERARWRLRPVEFDE
jgi:antitoxin FitA